jgi:hypothetical protein
MHGFVKENSLHKVRVEGNSQTLYFAKESNGDKMGLNKAESSDMLIYVKGNKVQRISFLSKPTAIMHPLKTLAADQRKLPDFRWLEKLRPENKSDIYDWKEE